MKPFSELKLLPDLEATLLELGFALMTPVQEATIPLFLEGRDLIVQAQTGSGKTAAFALPILQNLDLSRVEVQALILCPTRELGAQVATQIRTLGRKLKDLRVLLLAGGQPSRAQAERLLSGVHIVVGTPGRTLDHIERQRLDPRQLQYVVLDEADRILDMGFQDEMEQIRRHLPEPRQTALFSATYPEGIANLSRNFQKRPQKIEMATTQGEEFTPEGIQQLYFETEGESKTQSLIRVLQEFEPKSALVFCNQKSTISAVVEELNRAGAQTAGLHGDLEQRDRDQVLALFRNGSTRFLIATDVAARGLDIADLDLVVNYDLPHSAETFVHRVGRTGRAGRVGVALTLVSDNERLKLTELLGSTDIHPTAAKVGFRHQYTLKPDSPLRAALMQTLVITGGRKDKLRAGDILGALTGEVGALEAKSVGKIEIHERFSFVAIEARWAVKAMQRLQNGRIKNRRFLVKLLSR